MGGIETYLKDLAIEINKKGDKIEILLANQHGHSPFLLSDLKEARIKVKILQNYNYHWLLNCLKKKSLNDDTVIVTFDVLSYVFAEMIFRNESLVHITGIYHIDEWNYSRWPIMNLISKKILSKISADSFFVYNEFVRLKYSKLLSSVPPLVPIGVKTPKNKLVSIKNNNNLKILLLGRVVGWKSFLWQTVNYLKSVKFNFELHIVGDGNEMKNFKKHCTSNLDTNNTYFYLNIDKNNLIKLCQKMDISISVGTSAILSSSMGLPTIVGIENSDRSSLKNYGFFSNISGYTFQEKDANLKQYPYQIIENYLEFTDNEKTNIREAHIISARKFDLDVCLNIFKKYSKVAKNNLSQPYYSFFVIILFFINKLTPNFYQYWQRRIN